MEYPCKRIAAEKDPKAFDRLVEPNDVLELKYQRIHPEHSWPVRTGRVPESRLR
jgi:hypothetical protein